MTYWNRPENGCMDGWMDIEIETQMITCFWACKSISHRDRPMTGCIRHANPILRASSVLSKHVNVLRLVGASKAYSEYFGFSSKQWAVYGARITGVHLQKQKTVISDLKMEVWVQIPLLTSVFWQSPHCRTNKRLSYITQTGSLQVL